MPSLASVVRRVPGAIRLRRLIARFQYAVTLRFAQRRNYLFTQFCRLPTQLVVLVGPVLDFLVPKASDRDLRIIVFGSSTGAEAYSIASTLRTRRPDIRFHMECFDIEPNVIAHAQEARYSKEELSNAKSLPSDFIRLTFDASAAGFAVKPAIAAGVSFTHGDVLDETLIERLGQADIVVAQNFLYHLDRPNAERAFRHLFRLLKPRSVLFIDGTDLDMRARLTTEAGLSPCPVEFERIHEEGRVERGYAWPKIYWGLEPFNSGLPDPLRRYATIFFRDA